MNDGVLHADHIDTTEAYGLRFKVVEELWQSGVLSEIPQEFKLQQTIQVEEKTTAVNSSKFNFSDGHADHVDETGEYRRAWEEQFGLLQDQQSQTENTPADTEWKQFLQNLITEEKTKLNI